MRMKLINLEIENFKGLPSFALGPGGGNLIVTAEIGVGKTSIYDAFYWLFFDKDSNDDAKFSIRPLDKNNQPIPGVVVSVTAMTEIDGSLRTFKKEQHEKIVKKQLTGYETLCWIDDVPKKIGEYKEAIADIIPEDTFKLMTDLTQFCGGLHWSKRREFLLKLAGDIASPQGFDELVAALNGRPMADYKKVLTDRKKLYDKERKDIGPRLDEIHNQTKQYQANSDLDSSQLTAKRDQWKVTLADLGKQRDEILANESGRAEKQQHLNLLTQQKLQREAEIKNDPSAVQELVDEKTKLAEGLVKGQVAVAKAEQTLSLAETVLKGRQDKAESLLAQLNNERESYKALQSKGLDATCTLCGQALPENKVAEVEAKRTAELAKVAERAKGTRQVYDQINAEIDQQKTKIADLQKTQKEYQNKLIIAQQYVDARLPKIEEQIKNKPTPDPTKDEQWKSIVVEIEKTTKAIGPSMTDQLNEIEKKRTSVQVELTETNNILAIFDKLQDTKKRADELNAREKELGQLISDTEKEISQIEKYSQAESELIEGAVNGMFKHVEFKLFKQLLNGDTEPYCEATMNGVPYSGGLSTGQKILVGLDIIHVLSKRWDISVPLFIDHAESYTLPIETDCQIIRLYTQKGVKTLTVEKE